MRVLYVDDEPDIREIAKMALGLDAGIAAETAGSGAESLERAAEFRPDVILLDVMMPEMDGPTTLEGLRAREATREIPVAFITARMQTHEIERYKKLGAIAVLPKPFDPMLLAAQVRALVAAP